jgi:hypothetical protein
MAHELSDEIMIFFRSEGFYPVQAVKGISLTQQALDHAELNPGTLRIEDASGTVLWRIQ